METIKNVSTFTLYSLIISSSVTLAEPVKSARFAMSDTASFVEEKVSAFAINKQDFDPFGQPQDPHKKIVKAAPTKKAAQPTTAKKEQRILIEKEIVKLSKRINVLGQRLLIGNDTYKKRESIKVSVKGKTFPLKIMTIQRNKITFLNLTDQEFISLDLNNGAVIPNGGNTELPNNSNKTIELDE